MKLPLLAALMIGSPVLAENAQPVQPNPRISGIIQQVKPQSFSVRTDDGRTVTVALDQRSRVVSDTRLTPEGILPGDHLASDLTKTGDGKWRALVGHTQLEPFGNNALWFHPIAGRPGAMRILGIVESVQPDAGAAHVKVRYDSGELEFGVPANITLYHVTFEGPAILTPNAAVNAAVEKNPDGTLAGRFITVEKDGVTPIAERRDRSSA